MALNQMSCPIPFGLPSSYRQTDILRPSLSRLMG